MAIKIGQEFERTSKATRFKDDVMTKAQMLAGTDDNYSDGYLVVEKDSHDLYIYDVNATPSAETGKFVKVETCPEGGTAEQILAKKTDENGDVEWIEDIGRSLTQFDRKYGIISANVPITVRIAEFVRETYTYTEYRVPYGGIITSPSSISSGILNTFDAYVVVSGYSESKVKEYVSATGSYRLENSLLVKLDPITQSGNYAGIQTKETSNDRKVTSIRLVARGDNTFGMGDGTTPYDIRNLTGMVLDDLRVTGTAIPTDWGIASSGKLNMTRVESGVVGGTLNVSGFNFESADDYAISIIVRTGADGAWGDSRFYYTSKTTTAATLRAYTGSNTTSITAEYTIFAKGYGNNRMQSGGGSLPDGGTTGQALVKKSDTDGDVEWKTVQDTLVSGTNIKTINGNNILGEGDVVIRSGVGDEYDLTAMPSYNEVVADIANHNLRYIGGNWQVRSANKEASTVEITGIYANQKRTYYFEQSDADAPLPEPYTFSDGYTSDATMSVYTGLPYNGVSFSYGGGGYAQYELTDNTITFKHKHPRVDTPVEKTYNIGVKFKIDAEEWYGTYTDENNVTYQVYTKTIYIPSLPATAGVTGYPHGITGIKQILSAYGFTTDGFVLNAPRQTITDNIAIYQVQKGGNIAIEVGKDRSAKSAYVTLIYAKNN